MAKRLRRGQVVAVTFLDHVMGGNKPIRFKVAEERYREAAEAAKEEE